MLLRLLKNNRNGGILFIFLVLAGLWVSSFIQPGSPDSGYHMPFYRVLVKLVDNTPVAANFIAMLLHVVIAILLVRLNIKFFLIDVRTYMPATFYLLLAASNPELQRLSPVLIAGLFLMITLMILFNASEDRPDSLRIFNASLVLVAGSLFYLKMVWFVPFIWITISYFRPIRWREVLFPILAYAALLLFMVTYYWVFLDNIGKFNELILNALTIHREPPSFPISRIIHYGWVVFLIFLASLYIISGFQTGKIMVRKIYQVLFILFIYSVLFYLFVEPFDNDVFVLTAIPVSFLLANYFHQRKTRWYHELLLWIWIGTIVYLQVN